MVTVTYCNTRTHFSDTKAIFKTIPVTPYNTIGEKWVEIKEDSDLASQFLVTLRYGIPSIPWKLPSNLKTSNINT